MDHSGYPIHTLSPRDLDGPDMDAVLAIYDSSFPADEKEPARAFRERARRGRSDIYVAREGDDIAVMAAVLPVAGTGWGFLAYFAAEPRYRNRGLGARFLASLSTAARARGTTHILLELEDPARAPDDAARALRHRRLAFYLRAGARVLHAPYAIPSFVDGAAVPLHLMVLPADDLPTVDAATLRRVLAGFYPDFYTRDTDGKLLDQILTALPDPIAISEQLPAINPW